MKGIVFSIGLIIMASALFAQSAAAEAAFKRGVEYAGKEEYDAAITHFSEAIRLFPNYADALNERGSAYISRKDHDRAIADFTKAIAINPNYFGYYANRGIAYQQKGDYDRAMDDLVHALSMEPDNEVLQTLIAGVLVLQSVQIKEEEWYTIDTHALEAFKESLKPPSPPPPSLARGREYNKNENFTQAIVELTQAIREVPDLGDSYIERGYAYLMTGKEDLALADLTKALDLPVSIPPVRPFAYLLRGMVYEARGEYEKAIADWNESLKLNPNDKNVEQYIEQARAKMRQR
jgi:tetratricopeptide (TPR) repeat protein